MAHSRTLPLVIGTLMLCGCQPSGDPQRTSQEVPDTQRLSRPIARAADHPPARSKPAKAASVVARGGALGAELRSNQQALRDIRGLIRSSDSQAEALRSQVRQQDDTIAAQKQVLDTGADQDAEPGQIQATIAAAARVNDLARASLARYETTRSSLLERESWLRQRNAELEGRLNGRVVTPSGSAAVLRSATGSAGVRNAR